MKKLLQLSFLLLFAGSLTISGCSQSSSGGEVPSPSPGNNSNDWLIPSEQVFDGGPGKDGIPSIDNPQFSPIGEITFLAPDDLVVGVEVAGEIRAYPHPILDWHEIVNDEIAGLPLAITYCPLTGTAIGWKREVEGQRTTFGVSGLLYNTNLLPYDRATDSNWSQMLLKSVNGERIGTKIETYPVLETTWATWQQLFPDSKVLNLNTGFSRNYNRFPYGDYRTNHDFLLFPVANDDSRLPRKVRGLGVIVEDKTRFYTIDSFADGAVEIKNDAINGTEIVLIGSRQQNFLVAYQRRLSDGTLLQFEKNDETNTATIFKDQEGNRWNIFGVATSGPRTGERLSPLDSYIGYWFSWGSFYPGIDIAG